MNQQLLTVRDVAALLSVHPQTIWKWVSAGRLPKPIYIARKTPRWPINAQLTPTALLPASADFAEREEKPVNMG